MVIVLSKALISKRILGTHLRLAMYFSYDIELLYYNYISARIWYISYRLKSSVYNPVSRGCHDEAPLLIVLQCKPVHYIKRPSF